MAAPVLAYKKFYIVKPKESTNQIKNPRFDPPDFEHDWTAVGSGVTIAETGSEQRFGAYCMQVNPVSGGLSAVGYGGLSVENGLDYTFSAYIKATAGEEFSVSIRNSADAVKDLTTFTATGYWQRVEVTHTSAETVSTYRVYIHKTISTNDDPFYVDGAQFEQASKATTFIHGYERGCRWTGAARNSSSVRYSTTRYGGELLDLDDYCKVVSVTGLGHGDWNQILTKMTSGGDMYQGSIRKSRQFSIVVDFIGDTLGEIETNRKALIDAIRPDLLEGQEMVVRYQGFAANGDEATNPVDIVCVPLPSTLVDTPDLPTHQRAVLNFVVPSGLLDGAYNDGKELDLYANFPAEFIVKRSPSGDWCDFNSGTGDYDPLITGLNASVLCMAEAPDGKIYAGGVFTDAGGDGDADYLARWNPVSEAWEAVVAGISSFVTAMAFDANGDLYIGGNFTNLGDADGDGIVKITDLNGTPTINALGAGANGIVYSIEISPSGDVYVGGFFTVAGPFSYIAKWDGTAWSGLSTGLNNSVHALRFSPNGDLYIGGAFTNAAYPYLCKWNGTALSVVGTNTDINGIVYTLAFGQTGYLYVGGAFTNAGGNASADYIARWNGSSWSSLSTGTNNSVYEITVNSGKVYATGQFTTAGGLTLTDRVAVFTNGAWQALDINLPGTGRVDAILPASDGSIYIGGAFSTAAEDPDENAKTGVVALNLNVSSASANTYPFIQVRGPGTLKGITNFTTGKTISFDGLTLQAGEWINLFFDPLNLKFVGGWAGRGNLMRYVVAGSDYGDFYLMPGSNLISMFMTGTDANSGAFTFWTPRFWGLDGALL